MDGFIELINIKHHMKPFFVDMKDMSNEWIYLHLT